MAARTRLLLLGLALVAFVSAPAFAASECTAEDGPVNCEVCEGGGDANIIAGLPRLSGASNNLGDYDWFVCKEDPADPDKRVCEQPTIEPGLGADPRHPATYLAGVLGYISVAFFMCFWSAFCGCCVLCCKYCCNCSCCGKRHPTLSNPKSCFKLGFVRKSDGSYDYPTKSKIIMRVWMGLFAFFVVLFICLGQFKGNEGFTTAMTAVTKAPQPLVDVLIDVVEPFGDFIESIASDTVVTLVKDTNSTIFDTVNLASVTADADCVLARVVADLGPMMNWISGAVGTVNGVKAAIRSVPAAMDDITYQKNNITVGVNQLDSVLTSTIAYVRDDMGYAMDNATVALTDLQTLMNTASDSNTGTVGISADFTALGSAPTTAELNAARNTGTNNLDWVVNSGNDIRGSSGAAVAARTDLLSKLQAIHDDYDGLPNYATTGTKITNFNGFIDDTVQNNKLGKIADKFTRMVNVLDAMPDTNTTVKPAVDNVVTRVRNFNFNAINSVLDATENAVNARPDVSVLKAELAKVKDMRKAVVCAIDLVDEVFKLDDTIIDMSQFDQVKDVRNTLNNTVEQAISGIVSNEADLDTFEDELTKLDFADMRNSINDLSTTITGSLDDANVEGTLSDLGDLGGSVDFDVTVFDDITTLNDTMKNNKIDTSIVTALGSFETAKSSLITELNDVIADLTQWSGGYCSNDNSVSCTADGDCSGGTCDDIGVVRCKVTQTTACDPYDTTNNVNDCPGGADYCLVQRARILTLITALGNGGAPDVSTASASMTAIDGATGFGSEVTSLSNSMTTAKSDLDTTLANSGDFSTKLAELKTNLDGNFDVDSLTSDFDSVETSLDAVDINNLNSTVYDHDNQLSSVRDMLDNVEDARDMVKGLEEFLVVKIHPELQRLGRANLQRVRTEAGTSGLLLEIADVLDDIVVLVDEAITMAEIGPTTLADDLKPQMAILDVLSEAKYQDNGPLFFLASLAAASNGDIADGNIQPDDSVAHRWQVQADGTEYPDGAWCLTQACLDKEIEFVNSESLDTVTDGAIPIPFSRVNLVGLPFLIPLFIALMAFIAAICVCSGKCAQCCAGCVAGWTCCQMPLMFMFIGSLFVFPMFMGDMCYGIENVGYHYIEDSMTCGGINGEGPSLAECTIKPGGLEFQADVLGLYSGIFGSGGCPADSPIAQVFDTLADTLEDTLKEQTNSTLDGLGDNMQLRTPMVDIILGAADSMAGHAVVLVHGIRDVITCDAIHSVYAGFKSALCCDFVGAFYWMLASWYLITWTFCLCGCTGGLYARKRLGSPWGKEFNELGGGTGRRRGVKPQPAELATAQVVGYDGYGNEGAVGYDQSYDQGYDQGYDPNGWGHTQQPPAYNYPQQNGGGY